ncbi:MTH1187 family thiamine-binding protein [Bacillus sp. YZJH907-2]|uniref:MTH1187 family thiamine-binding protein n=1 Tax=Halalkalibacter suaedae TaxID=2822140 RepID=A0A940WRZ2_9BACI|nr:MTH1187 family thiamine-binding protein [Bacillus suaedae]MBP3951226.1 MTH1187 family thiamine-binding protein [Bacillus suaedae]
MVVKGLSYQKGIFYIGKEYVSCAYHEGGRLQSWVKPVNGKTMALMMKQVFLAMPLWFKIIPILLVTLIFLPKMSSALQWEGLPYYLLIYFMLGTHFIFPKQLRKYHGAEHKVFSYKGLISRGRLSLIKRAAITNRHCSTNAVVIYFLSVLFISLVLLILQFPLFRAIELASYSSVLMIPVVQKSMKLPHVGFLFRKPILTISYWLQVYVTTEEPERKHLLASIESYRKLAAEEFPERLIVRRKSTKKEEKSLAIVDVTIIPIGTETPSVSQYVAKIQEVLQSYEGKINYQLTPMSTLIEGELPILFEVIQAIHEVPFTYGIKRVATNIRIDDRRDKQSTMAGKLEAVQSKLTEANPQQNSAE